MANFFTQVASGAVKVWDEISSEVDKAESKVTAAVPAIAPETAALANDVKQGLSDLLGAAGTLLGQGAKPLATGIETAADAGLAGLTKGASVVLDPLVNSMIDMVVNMGLQTLQAWALAKKAEISGVSVAKPAEAAEEHPLSFTSTSTTLT